MSDMLVTANLLKACAQTAVHEVDQCQVDNAGFHKILIEKLPDNMSHKPRAGKEWIGRWRKTSASL